MRPVALTAFYCCALRERDARSATPVCGDQFATRFLDEAIRAELEPSLRLKGPSAGNVARHRLIDDLLRNELEGDRDQRIVLLGAGFDSRAFRLTGGHWWEFDDPGLLAFKEERLPAANAPNPLVRRPVDFRTDDLAEQLAGMNGDDRVIVVLEGVSMYLTASELTRLAATVRLAFPRALLICDLMSPAFARWFAPPLHRALNRLGAQFAPIIQHPRQAIEAAGFQARSATSIVGRAHEAGTVPIPRWVLATILRELRDGYQLWQFKTLG